MSIRIINIEERDYLYMKKSYQLMFIGPCITVLAEE